MPLHLLDNLANLSSPESARNVLDLGTGDSPQFASITLTSGGTITGNITLTGNLTASGIVASPEFSVSTTDGELTSTKDVRSWIVGTGTFDTSSQDTSPSDIFFRSDGLRMYIAGQTLDRVKSYQLNPDFPFDLSTASFLGQGPNISSSFDGSMDGLCFSDDGTYIFLTGNNVGRIARFILSTPWDITTMGSVPNQNVAISTITGMPATTTPRGLAFSGDGKTIFILDDTGNSLYQLSTTNAWDLTGIAYVATFGQSSFTGETSPTSVEFNNDGTRMFITGIFIQRIHEFRLTTPWNVSSGVTYVGRMESLFTDTQPQGLYYNDVVNKCFLIGSLTRLVREILVGPKLGLISTVTFSPTLNVGNLNVTSILAGSARITNATATISPTTGALVVAGGIGANGIHAGPILYATNVQGVGTDSGFLSLQFRASIRTAGSNNNGFIRLGNEGGTDFERLIFGQFTAAYPAIRKATTGVGLEIITATNTDFANLKAKDITATGPVTFPSITSAALTAYSASSYTGAMVFVPDDVDGATMAFSDGANWLRVRDNVPIS
jgi:hypothetical protein